MKIYKVYQDDIREKEIVRLESYVLADSLADVAKEFEHEQDELDHITIAITEVGTVTRNLCNENSD